MSWNTINQTTGSNQVAQTANNTSSQQGQASQANTYGQPQQSLQGQVPSLYSTLLQGQIPQSFTLPQAPLNNYEQQWQNWTAPQIAVNGGANSPMLAANKALGQSNLEANLYNTGVGNYENALGGATTAAFTPTGQSTSNNAAGQSALNQNTNQNYTQNNNNSYAAIQNILDILQQLPAP